MSDAGPPSLTDTLRQRIRQTGPISVADYIMAALFEPELGYYVAREPIGRDGDFITAPEISQVFGELIGVWSAETWRQMNEPRPVSLIELGPGRGTLMADALRALRTACPDLLRAAEVHLVEINEALRRAQASALVHLVEPGRLHWHATLADVPPGPALVIANEFFDVLPVDQVVRTADGWHRRCVGLAEDGQAFQYVVGDPCDVKIPDDLADGPMGGILELCPAGEACAEIIADRLDAGGVALIIDYGHAHSACGESLQAVRGHRKWPVLEEPGQADLTHHVDFQVLRRAAEGRAATVFGPVPQGLFLGRLGIEQRAARLAKGVSAEQAEAVMSGVRRLVNPRSMGLLFKVLAISRSAEPPPGFKV